MPGHPVPLAGGAAAPLVAVAHGSRDPRSAATVAALLDEVRRQRPDLDVRLSFLDLSAPRLADVLAAVRAAGHRRAVVVPLLLGRAFHADVDVPEAVRRGRHPGLDVAVADVLGGDRRLADAALRRLADAMTAGAAPRSPLDDPDLGVVLAGAGSSNPRANAAVARVIDGWTRRFGWRGGVAAFAAAAEPTVPQAIAALRARGARRVAVASWFLAPGRLPDRVAGAAHDAGAVTAAPLGADPWVAALVLDRYRTAVTAPAVGLGAAG